MNAPVVAPVEWWYDLSREADELGMEDAEGVDVLTSSAPRREDEGADDEIARVAEELATSSN